MWSVHEIRISCADHSNDYCTLVPLIGISCTDPTNDYCKLFLLVGISCTDQYQLEGTMYNNHLCDQYMKYQLEGTM
jgi:hypothetical protein